MHLMKHVLVGRFRSKAKDGVDAAIRAERGLATVNPMCDLTEREFSKAVKAPTNPRLRKH
jgi:hypothetical protein